MTLIRDTVRGVLWTIGLGMGSRVIGLVGTLLVTRFVTPHDYGEVAVAAVLVMSANQLSTLGLGQYLVSRPDAGPRAAFHATVFHILLGILTLSSVLAFGDRLAPALDAPQLARFLPGLTLAALFDRVSFVPERILARDLRFGTLSAMRTFADVAYSATSVALAALGWGAMAIVVGNVARAFVHLVLSTSNVKRTDWLAPCRISANETRELMAFGIPIWLGALAAFASRRWDNLLVSHFFGPGTAGSYNLAYNLADVPAIQVGEQIGDVLLPSFARLEEERRPLALLRSLRLLSLCVFPLAVGLGSVAFTLVEALFDPRWREIAPMLMLLSALSITRPVAWTVASYLQVRRYPRSLMGLELGKLAFLVALIVWVGRNGPLWVSAVVGIAYALHLLASLCVVWRADGVSLLRSLGSLVPALAACVPMVGCVLVARFLLADSGSGALLRLIVEVGSGALGYLGGSLLFARATVLDLRARLQEAIRRESSSS